MLSFLKKAAVAVAIIGASTSAFANQQFTVNTALDNNQSGLGIVEFNADQISGLYTESVTFNPNGTFSASIFLDLNAFSLDGVSLSGAASGFLNGSDSTFGGGYGLYSLINFTGSFAQVGTDFIVNNFTGALSVIFDKVGDSSANSTAPALVGGTSPTLMTAGTGTGSDDVVLATASVVGGNSVLTPTGSATSPGGFGLNSELFALTNAGESFFVAPRPFYLELLSTGDLGGAAEAFGNGALTAVTTGTSTTVTVFGNPARAFFVPEPSSLAFIGLGLLGAGFMSRRKKA